MRTVLLYAALLAGLFSLTAQAQGVTIGAAGPPDASAALEVRTTTQGLLLPRLTAAQREAIASPVAGLLIFQTDTSPGVYYFDGAFWHNLNDGSQALPPGAVSTLAGNGTAGFADGANTTAQFNLPYGVACDASGNVYVADQANNVIRRIEAATGAVSTLAGNVLVSGNLNGTGTAARFGAPSGVACDASGNVYVADQGNHRIRRIVAATGVVSTLAGSTQGFADGTGSAAQFNTPTGVACDASGNVYVADQYNQRIRRIVAATGAVSTLAGNGTAGFADATGSAAQFNRPYGVACDASGNVYVADRSNHRIRRIVAATGAVSTLAGNGTGGFADGPASTAQFNNPSGVACDASGNVYVADLLNNRIRRVVAATGVVSTRAGSGTAGFADGPPTTAQFNGPTGVACDASGTLYIADRGNDRIRVVK